MKKGLTIFLQALMVLIGIGALIFIIWEPTVEGVNVNATFSEMYLKDRFMLWVYLSYIIFSVGLYQAFKIFGQLRQASVSSQVIMKSLRVIKYCAMILIAIIAAGEVYLAIYVRGKDDIAGGIAMGLFMIFIFSIVALSVGIFERRGSSLN